MAEFEAVAAFVDAAQRARRMSALERLTEDTTRDLGFDYFAILHHVDLAKPGDAPGPGEVRFSNYPPSWRLAIQKERLVSVDPMLAASQRTARGFLWSDVGAMIELSARQKEMLALARREGLGEGYTVPLHVPGEVFGSSSFGVRYGKSVRAASLPLLHYIGSFAFEAARRVVAEPAPAATQLSERQIDCLVLAGRGESARAAAKALGIAQDTFQKHMLEAKARLGVRTTVQAVARALFDGRIAFKDIIKNRPPS